MDLVWDRLRVLNAVAEFGSVARAADLLHMSGPAVSQQLRRIEAETGVQVVKRDGRGIRLTEAGRILAQCASQVADLITRAENDLQGEDELTGEIRVGALASVIRGTLTASITTFGQDHPAVRIYLCDGETQAHLKDLSSGRLDVAVAESWSGAPLRAPAKLGVRRYRREQAYVAMPTSYSSHTDGPVRLAALATQPWATCARDSDGHAALAQAARRDGVELDFRYFVADHNTQIALVQEGSAFACIPLPEPPKTSPPGVTYRPMATPLHRDLVLLTPSRPTSRHIEAFTTHLSSATG